METMIASLAQLAGLVFLSVLAYWRPHVLLFLLIAGASQMIGLYWFPTYPNDVGLGVSLMLIGYAYVSFAFGYRVMLWEEED